MEEVSVIRTLGQSVSHTAKPSATPLGSVNPKSGGGRGTQPASASNEEVTTATSAGASQKKDSPIEVQAVIEGINQKLEIAHNTLRFQIDDSTEEIKVQVVDKETGKVVRTIPPEPSLSLLSQGEYSGLLSVQG